MSISKSEGTLTLGLYLKVRRGTMSISKSEGTLTLGLYLKVRGISKSEGGTLSQSQSL